ncbi:hypothetical protein IC582_008098 [Cucumis melo]
MVVLHLHEKLIAKPQPVTSTSTDARWQCFKNFLGVLDNTYIKVNMLASDRPRNTKHLWTKAEETCLVDLIIMGGWQSNNGTFLSGYLS